jgi:hypothetical protein
LLVVGDNGIGRDIATHHEGAARPQPEWRGPFHREGREEHEVKKVKLLTKLAAVPNVPIVAKDLNGERLKVPKFNGWDHCSGAAANSRT